MATDRFVGSPGRRLLSRLVNRYVVAAFVVQTLSYAVLVGAFEHGDATPLVGFTRHLPDVLAIGLGLFAVPALLLAVAAGALLESAFGVSLQNVGVGLVSASDLPVLVAAYILSVGVAALLSGWREHQDAD